MTTAQAEEFWREWQAFKGKWGFEVYGNIDRDVYAEMSDGSLIWLDHDYLSTGDLKPGVLPIADRAKSTAVTEWGKSQE